jgi:hypothetical protein
MTLRKHPRRQMHFDIEGINLTRLQIVRFAHRIPLRPIDPRASNLRDCAIRRYIREPGKPIRQRRRGRGSQQGMRTSQNRHVLLEGRRIVDQTESVHRSHIAQQFAPPESRLHARRRHVL